MHILITGGSGYKGSVLIPKLLKKNHTIYNVDTNWFGNFLPKHKNLFNIKEDVRNFNFDIKKKIAPDGLLVKSDFTADEFLTAFEMLVNNEIYVSKTVEDSIAELLLSDTFLDHNNRNIITLLASGILSKNLPNYIDLSMSSIDKRKAQIKDAFHIRNGNDEDIIREAKKHGFV